jgi:hypothetical protein
VRRTALPGHALRSEGQPYRCGEEDEPEWVRLRSWNGVGLCECGETSLPLNSNRARQKWHAAHKDEVRAEGSDQ